jgi:HEAT repeats
MASSQIPQVVEGFLKELLGARKALKLYPASNPLAAEWLQRVHRSVEAALKDGLPPLLRVAPGRFEWDGGQLATRDPALESLRFDLETRRVTELGVEPGVEPRELGELLACLNLRHEEVDAAGGLPNLLTQRQVTHIVVRGPLWAGETPGVGAPDVATARLDLLEKLVEAILEGLSEQFRDITYDRIRLLAWFLELSEPGERADVPFAAVQMLIPMIEAEPDREIRYRTMNECLIALPDPLRTHIFGDWLMPAVREDLNIVNLLTRFSGDEFAELVGLIPAPALEALKVDIEAIPSEEWKKARVTESIEDALAEKEVAAAPLEPLISPDDPDLFKLREASRLAADPESALFHSVSVFLHLIAETETEGYPVLLVDAMEEAVTEALSRNQLGLGLRILRALAHGERFRPEWQAEHQRRLELLFRRLAVRPQIGRLADLIRRRPGPEVLDEGTEYLRILGAEAIGEFVKLMADEQETAARARLLDVVTALGPLAGPALRARVADSRWVVTRTMIALLIRIGDPAALPDIERMARHHHPQVRREVARALATLGGKEALKPLLDYLGDPDGEVRLAAIRFLGALLDATTVVPLREFLVTPTRSASDLLVKRDMITALASIGSPEARSVLVAIAGRRVWPWQRNERTVRGMAGEALKSAPPTAATTGEA